MRSCTRYCIGHDIACAILVVRDRLAIIFVRTCYYRRSQGRVAIVTCYWCRIVALGRGIGYAILHHAGGQERSRGHAICLCDTMFVARPEARAV